MKKKCESCSDVSLCLFCAIEKDRSRPTEDAEDDNCSIAQRFGKHNFAIIPGIGKMGYCTFSLKINEWVFPDQQRRRRRRSNDTKVK